MSAADAVGPLLAQLDRCRTLLQRIVDEYAAFIDGDFKVLGRKNTSAIVVAELMVDYYTCVETLFLRVSQFFENDLDARRWHADLLDKMVLRIEGVRDPVLSEETAQYQTQGFTGGCHGWMHYTSWKCSKRPMRMKPNWS